MTTYKGLKGLRHRRSMYLGNPGLLDDGHAPRALNQTMQEIISNSIDEFLGGYGSTIRVTIHEDNSVTVKDNGRGMPKGPGKEFTSVIESLTEPHSSGKFEGEGYDATGVAGMNGIGLKATNATSRYMELHAISHSSVLKKGEEKPVLDGGVEEYRIKVNQEDILEKEIIRVWTKKEIEWVSSNEFKVIATDELIKTGTTITYLPDDGPTFEEGDNPVFESINWIVTDLYPRFESAAFLNAKLILDFTDERLRLEETVDENGTVIKPETEFLHKKWCYERGVEEYVEHMAKNQTLLSKFKNPITFDEELEEDGLKFRMQASLIMTDDIDTNLKTYANGVPTKEGGPHEDGFKLALAKAMNDYAKAKGLNKLKKGKKTTTLDSFRIDDVMEGLTGVFEIRVPSQIAEFEGQTKEKLATSQAKSVVNNITYRKVTDWLYDNEEASKQIVEKMIESKQARDSAIKARQDAKSARQSKTGIEKLTVLSKLKPATGKDPRKNELFIVEGDSASGGDKDKTFQGIMPLRGKIKNVEDVSLSEALANQEISTITAALGTGIGPAFDINELQYYKVIISCDADPDGKHIQMLLITLFYKFYRPIIERGHLFVSVPPLYKAYKYVKGELETKYYFSETEMAEHRQNLIDTGYSIARFKGLGEMDDEELGEAIFSPETRHIKRVTMEDVQKVKEKLKVLMGNDASLRKEWVKTNIDYDAIYELL